MLSRIRSTMMEQGMKLMASPTAMKLMQNPKFMMAMMTMMQLPEKVRGGLEKQATTMARMLNMPTNADVEKLRRTIRDLERSVDRLKSEQAQSSGSNGEG